nr:hypothetical protein [Planctomycetota bacterium]
RDFTRKPADRVLFRSIEPNVVPGDDPKAEAQIRATIVHLHEHLLGQQHEPDHPEVDRTYKLFTGIIADAHAKKFDKRGSYFCERVDGKYVEDPHYTIRAWRAVVTYLLRQHDFLYE